MNLNILIAHPYLAAGLVAFVGNLFVVGVAVWLSDPSFELHRQAVIGWWRQTFTTAGDGPRPGEPTDLEIAHRRIRQDIDGYPLRHHGLTEIMPISKADADLTLHRQSESFLRRRRK